MYRVYSPFLHFRVEVPILRKEFQSGLKNCMRIMVSVTKRKRVLARIIGSNSVLVG